MAAHPHTVQCSWHCGSTIAHQPRVMLDHRWLPAPNRAPQGEREMGDECWELQREQTLRRDGSPGRKNISAPQLMTAESPLPPTRFISPLHPARAVGGGAKGTFSIMLGAKEEERQKCIYVTKQLFQQEEEGGRVPLMRHFVLPFCIRCSFLLSVGNRFLVSIQQHKMSLSGGTESDEYIHLHSAALCSASRVCLCVLTRTKACVSVCAIHIYECVSVLESIT